MTKETHKIVISDAALMMLDTHVDFLAKVNKNAALKTMKIILNDAASLSENPQRYPAYENPFISENNYRKMLSAKRYLVFYEISKNTVFIDYIVDCRQDYTWLIQ